VFITFVVKGYEFPKLERTNKVVGVDVGIEKLLVTSEGEYLPNPKPYERAQGEEVAQDLVKEEVPLQELVQGQEVGQGLRAPEELQERPVHEAWEGFAEKYDVLVMEDRQATCGSLRRMRLHDVAFRELRSILKYQVEKYGKRLVLVDPSYTSRTCARCGHVRELTLADRTFTCPAVGWQTVTTTPPSTS
jgi:putative transposase